MSRGTYLPTYRAFGQFGGERLGKERGSSTRYGTVDRNQSSKQLAWDWFYGTRQATGEKKRKKA